MTGFIKLKRSVATWELLARDPLAFALLTHIALRARWRSALITDDLKPGEALIGDFENYGMTRSQYRTRIRRLVKWRQIDARSTPKGTIARLISTGIFDINEENGKNRPSEQPSKFTPGARDEQPTEEPTYGQAEAIGRPLTNNDDNDERERTLKRDALKATSNSIVTAGSNAHGSSSSFDFYQNQQSRFQDHVKWPEYRDWCHRNGGVPRESVFWTWLSRQKPHWQNKVGHNFDQSGYMLDGKFFTSDEANQLAMSNPDLLSKFRSAVKRGGKIQIS